MRFPTAEEREKRAKLIELIDEGLISVTLDARREGVQVPPRFAQNPALKLNLSRNFHLDILEFEPLCIKANLSFGGVRFLCVLPYNAIYLVSGNGQNCIFFNDAPPEIKEKYQELCAKMPAQKEETPKPAARPMLHAIEDDEEDESEDEEGESDQESDADELKEDAEETPKEDDSADSEENSPDDENPFRNKNGRPHLRLV